MTKKLTLFFLAGILFGQITPNNVNPNNKAGNGSKFVFSNSLAGSAGTLVCVDGSGNLKLSACAGFVSGISAGTGIGLTGSNPYTISNTGVLTFNGRSGAVSPTSGDYTFSLIGGSKQGNTNVPQMASGSPTSGHCLQYDSNGNAVDAGAACNTSTLPAGTQLQTLRIQPNTGNNTTTQFAFDSMVMNTDFDYTAQTPGGSLSIGSNTITLTPGPIGLNASFGTNPYLYQYISGGTGTAEAVQVTGGTCNGTGQSSCTVIVTCANTHTGAWTIKSATAGLAEAGIFAYANNLIVYIPNGTYLTYASTPVKNQIRYLGQNQRGVIIQPQGNTGVFDIQVSTSAGPRLEGFSMIGATQQTVGGYYIRVGNFAESSWTQLYDLYLEKCWDCTLTVNASHLKASWGVCYNFGNTCFNTSDAANPDWLGPQIEHWEMYNYTLGAAAFAGVKTTQGGIISNCLIAGAGGGQLTNGIYAIYPTTFPSTTTDLNIHNNNIQSVDGGAGVGAFGTFVNLVVTNNQFLQGGPGGHGVQTNDSGGTHGIEHVTIVGNQFQGSGTSPTYYAIDIEGHGNDYSITGNSFIRMTSPFYISGTITNVTIGPNAIDYTNISYPFFQINSGVLLALPFVIPYANWSTYTPAAGSIAQVSGVNATCSGAGSVTTTCIWNGAAFVH